jgi:hypothetical protein
MKKIYIYAATMLLLISSEASASKPDETKDMVRTGQNLPGQDPNATGQENQYKMTAEGMKKLAIWIYNHSKVAGNANDSISGAFAEAKKNCGFLTSDGGQVPFEEGRSIINSLSCNRSAVAAYVAGAKYIRERDVLAADLLKDPRERGAISSPINSVRPMGSPRPSGQGAAAVGPRQGVGRALTLKDKSRPAPPSVRPTPPPGPGQAPAFPPLPSVNSGN